MAHAYLRIKYEELQNADMYDLRSILGDVAGALSTSSI